MINLAPGPTVVPDFIAQILAQPPIPHRSKAFSILYEETRWLLQQYLLATDFTILPLSGCGTMGMEFLITNLPVSKLLSISFGKFSHRWSELAIAQGHQVFEITASWGSVPEMESALDLLKTHPIEVLCLTHTETSTATRLDIERWSYQARLIRPELIILVDVITSAGVMPLYTKEWGLDAVVLSSQKALGCPPGLSFVALGQRYLDFAQPKGFTLNLSRYLSADAQNQSPFTPATGLMMAVHASLQHQLKETLPYLWNRSHHLAQELRKQCERLGWKIFSQQPSDALTAIELPNSISALDVQHQLWEDFDIYVAEGQELLKDRILRISTMGYTQASDYILFYHALQSILS